MLSQVLSYGKFGNLFCSVEHCSIKGREKLNVLTLKKRKNEFQIDSVFECDTINKLNNQLQKEQHLIVIINNEQVLSKKIEGILESEKAVANAYPSLRIEDFYYEILQGEKNTFVSICRRSYVDELLSLYKTENYNVISYSLGGLAASQLIKFVKNTELNTSNSTISFSDKKVVNIAGSDTYFSTSYDINGLQVTPNSVLPLAGIITYYTNQKNTRSNFDENIAKLNDHFNQKRIFNIGLKSGLSVVFVLLLVSFLFFSSYSSKINSLTAELELNKTNKIALLKLSSEVNKKEQLVTNFSLTSSKASWYLDQIGISIPSTILLSEVQFQPLVKNIKKEEEIIIQDHVIVVKGRSSNSTIFSNWITKLEQQNWIEKVTIQDYGAGKKTITEFDLLIKIIK